MSSQDNQSQCERCNGYTWIIYPSGNKGPCPACRTATMTKVEGTGTQSTQQDSKTLEGLIAQLPQWDLGDNETWELGPLPHAEYDRYVASRVFLDDEGVMTHQTNFHAPTMAGAIEKLLADFKENPEELQNGQ